MLMFINIIAKQHVSSHKVRVYLPELGLKINHVKMLQLLIYSSIKMSTPVTCGPTQGTGNVLVNTS
jgi:hypothetical protein